MTHHPLDYRPRPRQSAWWRQWKWGLLALVVMLGMLIPLPRLLDRHVVTRIDPVTGSMMTTTTGPLWRAPTSVIIPSPLDTKLAAMGVQRTPNWQFLHGRHVGLLGQMTGRGCSVAPPIHQMRPALQMFVDTSSDQEIRTFVTIMQNGTEAEQQMAIDAAADRIFGDDIFSNGEMDVGK